MSVDPPLTSAGLHRCSSSSIPSPLAPAQGHGLVLVASASPSGDDVAAWAASAISGGGSTGPRSGRYLPSSSFPSPTPRPHLRPVGVPSASLCCSSLRPSCSPFDDTTHTCNSLRPLRPVPCVSATASPDRTVLAIAVAWDRLRFFLLALLN